MNTIVSSEVKENIFLSEKYPDEYTLANTAIVACSTCNANGIVIFAKDANYTKYNCGNCTAE